MHETPDRAAVAIHDTWDLTPLFPDDKAWEEAFAVYQKRSVALGEWHGRATCGAQELSTFLEERREVHRIGERLGEFASLRLAQDASDFAALDRSDRMQSAAARAAEAEAFFVPALQQVPEEEWGAWMNDRILSEWKVSLAKIRRFRPHTLAEGEEKLLAMVWEPLAGLHSGFSQLTNVDMRFGSLQDETGRDKELTQSSFSSFLQSPSPDVRREAFTAFYKEIGQHSFTLAALFASSVKADIFEARARRYRSARELSLFQDDVPEAVYDNLIEAVRGKLEPLYGYFELRRKRLGLAEIHHYDTYVPLVQSVRTRIPFEEASQVVCDALAPLGEEYVEILREGLGKGRWCDRYENKGKRSGAFSSGSYDGPPYILMNYKEDVFSDLYTLAHEAGHSMHTWMSRRAQPFQDYGYTIFAAEVASTFNEALLTHYLLKTTSDPAMRAYILNRQVDDIRGTLYRQTMFAEFEKTVHARAEAGEGVTLQAMRGWYRELLETYFGPRFTIDLDLELECLRIPHFYSAFYVYKYATGLSAAMALSRRVLEGGEDARQKYLAFLSAGGSQMPLDALLQAGVDMRSPDPIRQTLELFEDRVGELERVTA